MPAAISHWEKEFDDSSWGECRTATTAGAGTSCPRLLAVAAVTELTDELTILDTLALLKLEREVSRRLENQHDGRTQVELAEGGTLLDVDAFRVVV